MDWPPATGRFAAVLLLCALNAAMAVLLGVGALTSYSLAASLLVCALLGLSVLAWASLSPLTFFAPAALLQASAFLYVAPLTLNRWMEDVLTLERPDVISHGPVSRAIWLALLAAVVFSFAATPWALAGSGDRPAPPRRSFQGRRLAAVLLIVVGALSLAFLWRQLGGLQRLGGLSYGERYVAMRGWGVARVGVDLIFLGGVIYYASAGRRSPRLRRGLIVALLVVAFGLIFLLEQRRMALFQLVITFLVLRHTVVRRTPKSAVILLGVLVLGAGLFQGVFRGLSERSWTSVKQVPGIAFNLANSELGYPTLTIADVLARVPRHVDWLEGRSYLDSLGVLVPRAIWPNRPRALGELYVAEYYTDYWERGGGLGFTPVGEAFWNWGTLGVVAVFLFLGSIAQLGERAMASRLGRSPVLAMCYALVAPFLLMFYRFDSASFLKGSLVLVLPLLSVIATVETLAWMTRVRGRGGVAS